MGQTFMLRSRRISRISRFPELRPTAEEDPGASLGPVGRSSERPCGARLHPMTWSLPLQRFKHVKQTTMTAYSREINISEDLIPQRDDVKIIQDVWQG